MDIVFLAAIYIIFLIVITVAVIYSIYQYKNPPHDYAPNLLELKRQNSVANYNDIKENFLTPGKGTFVGFFNIQSGDRTGKLNGDMRALVNFGDTMVLEVSPVPRTVSDTFKKSENSLLTTAQLRVLTYGENGPKIEQISLPDIPMQKWVCIGVMKDGRRLDVVYDNQIVASRRLEHNLSVQPYGNLKIGVEDARNSTGLLGNCQHVFLINDRLNIQDFAAMREQYVRADGELTSSQSLPIPFLNTSLVTTGLPGIGDGVTSSKSNTLRKWYTPYN